VKDLPRDLEDQVLHDTFGPYTGFITLRRIPHFAFVEFDNVEHADVAMKSLQGHKFRPQDRPVLIFYDKNARDPTGVTSRKRKFSPDRNSSQSKSPRRESSRESTYSNRNFSTPVREKEHRYSSGHYEDNVRNRNTQNQPSYGRPDPSMLLQAQLFRNLPFAMNMNMQPPPPKGRELGKPCPTVFVSLLPLDVTERELSILFRFVPGYVGVRLVKKEGRPPICYVDFDETPNATFAITMFQGYKLDLRDQQGMSIEYDRSFMTKPQPFPKDREFSRDRPPFRNDDRDGERIERDDRYDRERRS